MHTNDRFEKGCGNVVCKRGERFGNVTERFQEMPGMGTTHIKVELFQRPVVGLGHILPGGCDVCLRSEQSTQPDV